MRSMPELLEEVVNEIELALIEPVITNKQAMVLELLRLDGIDEKTKGYAQLLSEYW